MGGLVSDTKFITMKLKEHCQELESKEGDVRKRVTFNTDQRSEDSSCYIWAELRMAACEASSSRWDMNTNTSAVG